MRYTMYVFFQKDYAVFAFDNAYDSAIERGKPFSDHDDEQEIGESYHSANEGDLLCISLEEEIDGRSFTCYIKERFESEFADGVIDAVSDLEELYSEVGEEVYEIESCNEITIGDVVYHEDVRDGSIAYKVVDVSDLNDWCMNY